MSVTTKQRAIRPVFTFIAAGVVGAWRAGSRSAVQYDGQSVGRWPVNTVDRAEPRRWAAGNIRCICPDVCVVCSPATAWHFTRMKRVVALFLDCIECMRCRLLYRCERCLSVTWLNSASLLKNGWTDQDADWGEHSWGPLEHCIRRGPDSPTARGGNSMQPSTNYFGLLFLSAERIC